MRPSWPPSFRPPEWKGLSVKHASSGRRILILAAAALILLVTILVGGAATSAAQPDRAAPTIRTADGVVRGVSADGADHFLGLPYAAPPLKDLRFRAPRPTAPWNGVRDASRQAPACLQFQPGGVRESQALSEDCLYLDLYRPTETRATNRLPVLAWYHGGGTTQGTGVIYGGQTMAALTHTIVISINYRLGALGYFALPPSHPTTLVLRPTGNTLTTNVAGEHSCAFWAALAG
jgi:para-nitrobenzyl esterase